MEQPDLQSQTTRILPVDALGVNEISPGVFRFGILIPWISPTEGRRVTLRIMREEDSAAVCARPREFELRHSERPPHGDYWSADIQLVPSVGASGDKAWGRPGRYIYNYRIQTAGGRSAEEVLDPFARESGPGCFSSFSFGEEPYRWSRHESSWQTPRLQDLVLYEVMVPTFSGDLSGALRRLDYLAELGVNAIELTPIFSAARLGDYLPLSHIAIDGRLGRAVDAKRLADAAHQRGMAVILDVVYAHTGSGFPYLSAYRQLGFEANPMMGSFARDEFGESTDFRKAFTRDYFLTVNAILLADYHVDGFRYDHVPGFWDGPTGDGFANLAYQTYRFVRSRAGEGGFWARFRDEKGNRLIQCAEDLSRPERVLAESYANCTWQTRTLDAACRVARGEAGGIADLGLRLGAWDFPSTAKLNGECLTKAVVHYVENHDHGRFVRNFARNGSGDADPIPCRGEWRKLRPYLIALFTAKGVPMLWQGQEFASDEESGGLAERDSTPMRALEWTLASDDCGANLRRLIARLARLRRKHEEFRSGEHYFHSRFQQPGLLLFSRYDAARFSLVALNFGDHPLRAMYRFARAGDYFERLHGQAAHRHVTEGEQRAIQVPPHHGCIWIRTDVPPGG